MHIHTYTTLVQSYTNVCTHIHNECDCITIYTTVTHIHIPINTIHNETYISCKTSHYKSMKHILIQSNMYSTMH